MAHLDTHCHWDDPRFAPDRAQVAERARQAGVTRLIVPGLDVPSWARPLELPADFRAYRAAGLHPAFEHGPDALEQLDRALTTGDFVAVGEIGLDKRFPREGNPALLASQLDLALAHDRPVILHVVHLHQEVLALLGARRGLRGILHAFPGPWKLAKRYLDLGFVVGIGGSVSWQTAGRLRETVPKLPRDGFVVETDAPDMAPLWRKGERNEPSELTRIAGVIAALRQEMVPEVLAASAASAARLGFEGRP